MSLFVIFKFPTSSVPRTSRRRRERNPDDRWTLPGGRCRGDIAGAQDKVSDQGITEQRRMVSPSVARGGVTACATLGNTARGV
ncbi:unnamed protein product, partial [Staurois parvus]